MEGTTEQVTPVEASSGMDNTSSDLNESAASEDAQAPQANGVTVEATPVPAAKKSEASDDDGSKPEGKPFPAPRDKVEINLHTLLKAGVHFGHQSSRWHPGMKQNIYTTRNGIHIINIPKTIQAWGDARKRIVELAARGGSILFVGTKKQAQEAMIEEATRCGGFYVVQRWLGGMITNFRTIRNSIERMKKLEATLADEEQKQKFTKKELLMMDREREKLAFSLSGIRDMYGTPAMMFVVDTKREDIAVKEAQRLNIPVFGLVDTNSDPSTVDYAIPSNDDASRAIRLFCSAVADAVLEGKQIYAERSRAVKTRTSDSAAPQQAELAKDIKEQSKLAAEGGEKKTTKETAKAADTAKSEAAAEQK